MEKEKEAMRKERMNDRGFSLVELIIVIAIMAILIVVLAPQYLKYVERSRNSTDLQNAVTMRTAVETYAADPQATKAFKDGESFEIKIEQTGGDVVSDVASGAAAEALKEAGLTVTDIKCSSKTAWDEYSLKGAVQSDGTIKWTYTGDDFSNAMTGSTSGT